MRREVRIPGRDIRMLMVTVVLGNKTLARSGPATQSRRYETFGSLERPNGVANSPQANKPGPVTATGSIKRWL